MELVVAVAAAVTAAVAAWIARGAFGPRWAVRSEQKVRQRLERVRAEAERTEAEVAERRAGLESLAKDEADRLKAEAEVELKARRAEIARLEERVLQKEESFEARQNDLSRRERAMVDRERNVENLANELKEKRKEHVRELERVAGLSGADAKQILLKEIEQDLRHESGKLIREIEEETKQEADQRARKVLTTCMQRVAAGQVAETTVSLVSLESDDMKGRIIGKEGRNIRSLESTTGVDFIIDDTPSAVVLSSFDGVRREIARQTLEKLLQDGRINPTRIEEVYYSSKSEVENTIVEAGEQATFEVDVHGLHPELVKLLGQMKFRTSYGQNVLAHSVECARLASLLADELGASSKTAKRAALLHDIGKAVSHEVEGSHALVGGQLARRYGEGEEVTHAMESHHNEVEIKTVEAVIVQIADALSGARPGARGESLDRYVKRLKEIEEIASTHKGVEKVFAVQAGREVRIIVKPNEVDDNEAAVISREVAKEIEQRLEYPGKIKVNVIRELRAVEYAR